MTFKLLTNDLYISTQLMQHQIEQAAKEGIKTIINNRPDQEEISQPLSKELEKKALELGLHYAHLPVNPGNFTHEDAEKFVQILEQNPSPYLAFCRTGNRSCNLWALSQKNIHSEENLHKWASKVGFKLTAI